MSNQFLKLRRSAVKGKVPDTGSIDFGEIALNTYDGLAFIKKSGSNGEEIVTIGSTQGAFTGSFSGSFTGNLQGTSSWATNALTASYVANLPVIDSSRIVTGSITASVGVEFDKAFKVENSIADPSGNTTLLLINHSGSVAINTGSLDPLNPETLLIVSHDDTTYNLIVGRSNTDNYSQFNIQNNSSGSLASSDIVATNNIGDENDYYIDLGINSSTYNNPFFVGSANDTYLYSKADDFYIGNVKADKRIIIFNGGSDAFTNAKVFIHPEGVIGINTATTSSITSPALPALRILASPLAPNTYNLIQAESNVDTYSQILIQNLNAGSSASADIVAENDLGTETGYYVDMGINSSTHVIDPNYSVGGPNDTYLLSTGRNHYIGSSTTGSLTFFTNNNFDGEAGAKLILRYNNRHEITGSLNAPDITGSLFGTASWALNSLTASSAVSAISSSYPISVTGSTLYSTNPVAGIPSGYATENSIFLGQNAGYSSSGASYSNFIGYRAGYSASDAYNSNFIGPDAGYEANNAYESHFIGDSAGKYATNANASNFIGTLSGVQAINASYSNFLGRSAGQYASDANNSNFVGQNAGNTATNANDSNFFGQNAGSYATYANRANFIGKEAGQNATYAQYSNFFGDSAGSGATNAVASNFMGSFAGYTANNSQRSNFIGDNAGNNATDAPFSNFIGYQAGAGAYNAKKSVFIGSNPGYNAFNASHSVFIGDETGNGATLAAFSVLLGYNVARSSNIGGNNIIIGTNITLEDNRKDSINLGGLIFATGSYSVTSSIGINPPFSGSSNGRVGINQPNPRFGLDVSGSGRYTNGLQVTSSLIAPSITGSLFGTASWALNSLTASIANSALTASFGGNFTASNALINGTITAQTLVVQTVTSSVLYSSGSNVFGNSLSNTQVFTGSVTITGSLNVNGNSVVTSNQTGSMSVATASFATSASFAVNAASSSYPIAVTGSTIYSFNASAPRGSSTNRSIFLGLNAGRLASFADYSTFIGDEAGNGATSASVSVFIGSSAGVDSTNVASSVFIGQIAGSEANRASYSNFIGEAAGQLARSASYSNFMGYNAGYRAQFASHSILIGRFAGANTLVTNGIGPNNIILGTNITVPDNQANSINLGAIIFATGSYSNILGNPFSGTTNGRVGINQPSPLFNLDVSGSGRYTTGLTVTGSLIAPNITGSLQGTASWAQNTLSSSFAATSSYAVSTFDIGIAEFNTTSSLTSAGTTIVSSINTGSFTSAFYNYTIASGSNARAGQVMSVWSGSTVRYTEVTTTDLGNTATASFAVVISGPTVQLSFTAPGVWRVKSIANLL